jgi:hypothetical protein
MVAAEYELVVKTGSDVEAVPAKLNSDIQWSDINFTIGDKAKPTK